MKGVTRARSTKRRRNAKRSDKDERGKCTRGTGAEESEEGKRREKDGKEDETAKGEVERERGKRGRERTSGNGSIESAAQRNAPPLLWSGSFAGTHHRVRVRQKEREREKDGERGEREMVKEEREREKEGKAHQIHHAVTNPISFERNNQTR